MSEGLTFVMAGGGTGGHVIPALAVARELRRRGHQTVFVGTRRGMEAKLAPAEGFPIEWIEIGGLKRVGAGQTVITLWQLPRSAARAAQVLRARKAAAVFSMGGYVAGPVMLAAWWRRVPMVLMEPNAIPGMTSRWMGRFVERALLSFPEAAAGFPAGRTELTGLPVRGEFFAIPPKPRESRLTVLITGGSRGSRKLNQAARESWRFFREAAFPVRLLHQTGPQDHAELERGFQESGLDGEVTPFIEDMPAAFARADLLVCRSGAGAVAELAAAGKPAILVPFPFAADQHQLRNAEAIERAGAARLVPDAELTGERLFRETAQMAAEEGLLERMGQAARGLARQGAAERAADLLEELGTAGRLPLTQHPESRNNTI
jgi:UDP-N-acetylglucosamine--N-acetylmuramyl-(pentapeptide) pyrophosphoryl-undecaprenol N-acetylglucosamine transferase